MQLIDFDQPVCGTIVKRPSAKIKSPYVADVEINGQSYIAHCPSLGLGGIIVPGVEVIMTASSTKSKTDFVVQAVRDSNNIWVGNVPLHANRIVKRLLDTNLLVPDVLSYKAEHTFGDSRFDFLIETDCGSIFCEVKSVHIKDPNNNDIAMFPVGNKRNQETISVRANKHVTGLTEIAQDAKRAMIVFVVQREDCHMFEPNRVSDPTFSNLLDAAQVAGVKVKMVYTAVNESGIRLVCVKDS